MGVCSSGITTGNHYYTDCCGNFVQGVNTDVIITFDYSKPHNGITNLNVPYSTTCPTPTPTPTPTITPTQTITPTITPSPTKTPTKTPYPSQTPSNSPIYTYKNDCTLFTLFDMGLICVPLAQPSAFGATDGILSVKITGGTSPYSYYWKGGQRVQTLVGIPAGDYELTVVDYYGDYTASTVCSLYQPTPSPTATPTNTPTPTSTPNYTKLCLISTTNGISSGPYQFVWTGSYVNNKPSWTSGSLIMSWSSTSNRWEISNWTATTGIPINTNNTTIPNNSWQIAGGPASTLTLTEGNCPTFLPLSMSIQSTNSTCSDNKNCNGAITITLEGGLKTYFVSIDGINYKPVDGNVFTFNDLCPSTYTITAKDSFGNTQTSSVVISSVNNPIAYTVGIELVKTEGDKINTNSTTAAQTATWKLNINPPLPVGTTLSVKLNVNTTQQVQGPFAVGGASATGTISQEIKVYKNNVLQTPTTPGVLSAGQISQRPNCNADIETKTSNQIYDVSVGNNDIINGTLYSNLTFVSCVLGADGCASSLVQDILISTSSPILDGCTCCNVSNNGATTGVIGHTLNGCPPPSSPLEPQASGYLVYEIKNKEGGDADVIFTLSKIPGNNATINQITFPFNVPFEYFINCNGPILPNPQSNISSGDSQKIIEYNDNNCQLSWGSPYPVFIKSPFTMFDGGQFRYTYGGKLYTIYISGIAQNNF